MASGSGALVLRKLSDNYVEDGGQSSILIAISLFQLYLRRCTLIQNYAQYNLATHTVNIQGRSTSSSLTIYGVNLSDISVSLQVCKIYLFVFPTTTNIKGIVYGDTVSWNGTASALLTSFSGTTVNSLISFNGGVGVTKFLLLVNYQSEFLSVTANLRYFADCTNVINGTANVALYLTNFLFEKSFWRSIEIMLELLLLYLMLR